MVLCVVNDNACSANRLVTKLVEYKRRVNELAASSISKLNSRETNWDRNHDRNIIRDIRTTIQCRYIYIKKMHERVKDVVFALSLESRAVQKETLEPPVAISREMSHWLVVRS